MSSDLLFFSGFEGCTSNVDIRALFTSGGVEYSSTGGFLGSKGGRCLRSAATYVFGQTLKQIYVGAHLRINQYGNPGSSYERSILRILRSSNSVGIFAHATSTLRLQVDNKMQELIVCPIAVDIYFHAEMHINLDTGRLYLKINGITEFDESGLDLGESDITSFGVIGIDMWMMSNATLLFDNLWAHKSKSLGQPICFYSLPSNDGHYDSVSGEFATNDASEHLYAKLQTVSADNYIYASVPDAKFTCLHTEIPLGFRPVGLALQNVCRHYSGGGLLLIQDFSRFDGIDYSGESRAVLDTYTPHYLHRTLYDKNFDDTELQRASLNATEFGSKLVEPE